MTTSKLSNDRIKDLHRQIAMVEHICPGNLRSRRLACGKIRCRCKEDPPALHGPYYYWSRRRQGRLVQTVLSPEQAKFVRKAIRSFRGIQKLLRQWQEETAKHIETMR